MADLAMSVTISRAALALPPLQLNDHDAYYIGTQLLGGQVQYNRNSVTSPFVDGAVTTYRTRQVLNEQITVEVLGENAYDCRVHLDDLITAVSQDSFTLTVIIAGVTYAYACEAADFQLAWSGPRVMANQYQVQLTLPRQPVPLTGVA